MRLLSGAMTALCLLLLGLRAPAEAQPTAAPVKIGMVGTLFTDVPQPLIDIVAPAFSGLMKEFTGIEGKMIAGGRPFEVARKLNDGELDLAVFYGVEFGWVKQKHPELAPLMVAVNRHRHVKSFLVVRNDSDAKSFADLKGKDIAFPKRSKEHCRLFLERGAHQCEQCEPKKFFGQVVQSANVFDALDDLCRGKLQGVITDTLSMEDYDSIKPGCFARLKVIQESELFPPACIAYKRGALDEKTILRFREGMANANKNERGRNMMGLFKVSAFEEVPADYHQNLADIIKAYPAPAK